MHLAITGSGQTKTTPKRYPCFPPAYRFALLFSPLRVDISSLENRGSCEMDEARSGGPSIGSPRDEARSAGELQGGVGGEPAACGGGDGGGGCDPG